jgi:ABC-type Fe3+/spermidine/putrescine transport system ATPase subunit
MRPDSVDRVRVEARGMIKSGDQARLAVRPAGCDVSSTPKPGFNAVPAKVVHSTYRGNNWQVALRVGNTSVTAMTLAQAPANEASVFVVWPENTGALLPAAASV